MAELTINTADITAALRKNLEGFQPDLAAAQVGRVLEVGDGIAPTRAKPATLFVDLRGPSADAGSLGQLESPRPTPGPEHPTGTDEPSGRRDARLTSHRDLSAPSKGVRDEEPG